MKVDNAEIVLGKLTNQHAYAYALTKEAIELANKEYGEFKDYTLTATGHSLGGWLAQLSVFHAHNDFGYKFIRGVTFDSPGAYEIVEQLQSNLVQNKINYKQLEIIEYVSALNPVNSCNNHLGRVYHVKVDISLKKMSEMGTLGRLADKLSSVFEKISPVDTDNLTPKEMKAIISLASHSLKHLVKAFNKKTGRPENYSLVKDWPHVEYAKGRFQESYPSKKIAETIVKTFKGVIFSFSANYNYHANVIKKVFSSPDLDKVAEASMQSLAKDTVVALFRGKLKFSKQYLAAYNYLSNNYGILESQESIEEFNQKFSAHISLAKLSSNTQKVDLNDNTHFSNKYITYIARAYDALSSSDTTFFASLIKDFYGQFQIDDPEGNGYEFKPKGDVFDIHLAREQAEYIVADINPKDISKQSRLVTGWELHKIETLHKLISDNLIPYPEEGFIGREKELTELKNKLHTHGEIIIYGPKGNGKSATAVQLTKELGYDLILQVKGVSGINALYNKYQELANELKMDLGATINEENVANQVNKVLRSLIEASNKKVALILDDLKGDKTYLEIKNLLGQFKHVGGKVVITTQNSKLGKKPYSFYLDNFEDNDAKQFIYKHLPDLEDIETLHCGTKNSYQNSPEMLKRLINYIEENNFDSGDYLGLYNDEEGNIKEIGLISDLLLGEVEPKPWNLLQYIIYLGKEPIPRIIFEGAFERRELTEITGKLAETSIITYKGPRGTFTVPDFARESIERYRKLIEQGYMESHELLGKEEITSYLTEKLLEKWPKEGSEQEKLFLVHSNSLFSKMSLFDIQKGGVAFQLYCKVQARGKEVFGNDDDDDTPPSSDYHQELGDNEEFITISIPIEESTESTSSSTDTTHSQSKEQVNTGGTEWFNSGQMASISSAICKNGNIVVAPSVDAHIQRGATGSVESVLKENTAGNTIFMFLNLSENPNAQEGSGTHWVLGIVERNMDSIPNIKLVDPLGSNSPYYDALLNMQDRLYDFFKDKANIQIERLGIQNDDYNCGPYVLSIFERIQAAKSIEDELESIKISPPEIQSDRTRYLNILQEMEEGENVRTSRDNGVEENTSGYANTPSSALSNGGNKLSHKVEIYGIMILDEKLKEQYIHYLRTGEVFETLNTYYPQTAIETNEFEVTQQNCTACAKEVKMPELFETPEINYVSFVL